MKFRILLLLRIVSALTWELPQTIIGTAVAAFLIIFCNGKLWISRLGLIPTFYIEQNFKNFGIGIGPFFTLSESYGGYLWAQTVKHEYGHTVQSMILGPLFIPLVAVPSLTFNILTRLKIVKPEKYYKRPWEKAASILGHSNLQ